MKIPLLFLVISAIICINGCSKQGETKKSGLSFDASLILKNREEAVLWFRSSPESPVRQFSNRDKYLLQYYGPDKKYAVYASVIKDKQQDTVIMLTRRQNDFRKFINWGKLRFRLGGKTRTLRAYKYLDPALKNRIFIPFADRTNGIETYEAGRYLESELIQYKKVLLDFNYAYNPYCHYNHNYSCPLVPDENYLDMEIKAGEKIVKFEE